MRPVLTLTLLLLALGSAMAQSYKVVRPDGLVEFTDQPELAAEEMRLPGVQTYSSPPLPAAAPAPTQTPPDAAAGSKADYEEIAVVAPQDEETVWADDNLLTVSVQVLPELGEGDQVVIRMNGKEVARGANTSFTLEQVYRDTYVINAAVEDSSGATLVASRPVTVFVKQHSILLGPR